MIDEKNNINKLLSISQNYIKSKQMLINLNVQLVFLTQHNKVEERITALTVKEDGVKCVIPTLVE